jgi:hypothetical protein
MGPWAELTGRSSALAGGERAAALLAVRVLGTRASDELVAAAGSSERGRKLVAGLNADGDYEQSMISMLRIAANAEGYSPMETANTMENFMIVFEKRRCEVINVREREAGTTQLLDGKAKRKKAVGSTSRTEEPSTA